MALRSDALLGHLAQRRRRCQAASSGLVAPFLHRTAVLLPRFFRVTRGPHPHPETSTGNNTFWTFVSTLLQSFQMRSRSELMVQARGREMVKPRWGAGSPSTV